MLAGKKYNDLAVSRQLIKVTVSSTQILSLLTVPVTIIPAVPGYVIFMEFGLIEKLTGTPYGIAGITANSFALKYTNSAGIGMFSISVGGFMDSASALTSFLLGPQTGVGASPYSGLLTASTNLVNQPITLSILGANFTAGDMPLTFTLFFRLLPYNFGYD